MTPPAAGGEVCVIGSVNVDTTLMLPTLPRPGETLLATGRHRSHGGKGANQAVAAATLGSVVTLVAAVGDDADGYAEREHLRSRAVDVSGVQTVRQAPTGTAVILVDDDSENVIVVDPGANAQLDPAWVGGQVARMDAAVIIAQLEMPVACLVAAAQAARQGYFVLNPAPMVADPAGLVSLLELTDILVPNRSELGHMVGRREPASLTEVDQYAARLAFEGTLVVTLGSDGSAVYGPWGAERIAHLPAAQVEAKDTSGAGDAFCGVMVDRLARGDSVLDAVERATSLAGLSTTLLGAQVPPSFPRSPG